MQWPMSCYLFVELCTESSDPENKKTDYCIQTVVHDCNDRPHRQLASFAVDTKAHKSEGGQSMNDSGPRATSEAPEDDERALKLE